MHKFVARYHAQQHIKYIKWRHNINPQRQREREREVAPRQ